MIFALDTNVILDVLFQDEEFHETSRETLENKSEEGFFVISPEVYSELVAAFKTRFENPVEKLDSFLEEKQIVLEPHGRSSLGAAGKKWMEYSSSDEVECPECGSENVFECESCGEDVTWRNHLITDFMIGGHAQEKADALITRDEGYFRNYFEVEIVDPSD